VLFDTDILIWAEKGNTKAIDLIEASEERFISVQSHMELIQGARAHSDIENVKSFLSDAEFHVLPLTENIGHRALIYVEEYALSSGIRSGDAIIAATAVENNVVLTTSNQKHFRAVRDLKLRVFHP
jgi:predicted nucleic acid-binding protein